MNVSRSKPSSSSSHSPSPGPISPEQRRTRDTGLCQTSEIPEIPTRCIEDLNSILLGKGTYGVVDKARYRKSPDHEYRHVAIKYANNSPSHLAVLIREAKVMMSLQDHPNVIKIFGLFTSSRKGRGVVMEYMDCGCMADLIYSRKHIDYTIDHFASWMYQLSSAVDFFHQNDQVHRDLKLQNMLLCDRYRTMKLCDFGTFTSMHQSMTSNRGTPITMAPEIFRCEAYNTKSDIYSVGIIMWQLMARDHPYNQNLSVPGLLYNVATANLRPPELKCNTIFSGFYEKCWHNDPNVRPTSSECVQYFECLRDEFPKGNEPLSDSMTHEPARTPQPKPIRESPMSGSGSASGSGASRGYGKTPTPSNLLDPLNPKPKGHRKTGSDQTTMISLDVPTPSATAPVAPGIKGVRSKSVAADLHHSATGTNGHIRPHREAPPPPPPQRLDSRKNSEERQQMFLSVLDDQDLRPEDPDVRDEVSMKMFHEHCQECKEFVNVCDLKHQMRIAKHKAMRQESEYERRAALLEWRRKLRQAIAKIERNSSSTDDESAMLRL